MADGIRKIALIDLNAGPLFAAVKYLTEIDASVTAIQIETDVSKEEQVDRAVATTVKRFGRIDVCLNAAGISGKAGGTAALKTEDYDQVLDVNLKGVWYCERAQIRQMLKQEMRDLRLVSGLKMVRTEADVE